MQQFKWILFVMCLLIGLMELLYGEKIYYTSVVMLSFFLFFGVLISLVDIFIIKHDSSKIMKSILIFSIILMSGALTYILF